MVHHFVASVENRASNQVRGEMGYFSTVFVHDMRGQFSWVWQNAPCALLCAYGPLAWEVFLFSVSHAGYNFVILFTRGFYFSGWFVGAKPWDMTACHMLSSRTASSEHASTVKCEGTAARFSARVRRARHASVKRPPRCANRANRARRGHRQVRTFDNELMAFFSYSTIAKYS